VITETEQMFGRLIGEDIQLITWLSPALGRVMADASQMHQVLMNLLVNARDAMPRGGKVVLETRNVEADEDFLRRHPDLQPGPYVCLRVSDTGAGMSEEVQQHLFEPFFTTKEQGKGTGLGLATVYGIVQQAGGKIEVVSKPEDGTTFMIYLPQVSAVMEEASRQETDDPRCGSETVLLVEDQDSVRQYIHFVLQDSGYRVIEASTGLEALAIAERFDGVIHLLLTDMVLPLMNGREVAEKLRAVRPQVHVVFMSGYAEETLGSRGLAADGVLQKPFGPEELTREVRRALGNPEGRFDATA